MSFARKARRVIRRQAGARRCPYCGAVVLFDDARLVTSHQAPICSGWDKLMRASGARELGPELLEGGDDYEGDEN